MKMKIAQIVPYDPSRVESSGVMLFIKRLIPNLDKIGIKTKVLGLARGPYTKLDFEFVEICRAKRAAAYKYDLFLAIDGKKAVKDCDILHAHKVEFLLPFLHIKKPKILTLHTNYYYGVFFRKNRILAHIYTLVEKIVLKDAEKYHIKRIVFVDKPTMLDYIKRFPNLKNISEVMSVGIDLEKFQKTKDYRKILGIPKDHKIILSVGRLAKEKALELAIEAYKKIADKKTHLIIVGDGPEMENLKKVANNHDSIRFLGAIKYDEIPAIMKASNLFIMSSVYEGTPTTILEAFAAGIPVVSTDAGGIKDIIVDGYNGVVVKRDAKEFSQAMLKYLNTDCTKNCLKSATKYSMKTVSKRYKEIYFEEMKNMHNKK